MIKITTPINNKIIYELSLGDKISISGDIYTGRDMALPKLVEDIKNNNPPFNLNGIAIMHTGVSDAGFGPTTSNKEEIESNIGFLSENGVKMHIGKGSLSEKTIKELDKNNSVFVITPPITAVLSNCLIEKKVIAYNELGIEAIYKLKVENIPGIIAISKGKSI